MSCQVFPTENKPVLANCAADYFPGVTLYKFLINKQTKNKCVLPQIFDKSLIPLRDSLERLKAHVTSLCLTLE